MTIKFSNAQIILILLCLLHLVVNIFWLSLNEQPIAWDQAGHTRLAIQFARYFEGSFKLSTPFLNISSYYPPLTHLFVSLFIIAFGASIFVATFPITIYFILLLIGIFVFIKYLTKNESIAVLTSIFFSFYPPIYESSRSFLLEIPLMTLLIWSFYLLAKTDGFNKVKESFIFALLCIAIILTKWIGIVFLIVPIGLVLYQRYKNGWQQKHTVLLIFLSSTIGFVVAPWYLANINRLIEIGSLASKGEITDPVSLLSLKNFLFYLVTFINFQLTLWPALAALMTSAFFFFSKHSKWKSQILLFLIFNYLVFTLISNKDIRYTLPLLFIVSYTTSSQLFWWWKEKKQTGLLLAVGSLVFLFIQYWILSFHLLPAYQRAINFGPLGWIDYINTGDIIVKYPKRDLTPNKSILQYLIERQKNQGISVMVGIDQPDINPSTLDFLITQNDYWQISLEAPYNLIDGFKSDIEVEKYLSRFSYLLIPTGEVGPDAVRHKRSLEQIRDYVIEQRGILYQELQYFKLNTHPGEVLVFQHVK